MANDMTPGEVRRFTCEGWVMRLLTLIRSWRNFHSSKPWYGVWQCCQLSNGRTGAACQRLKGHFGKHKSYHGEVWKQ